MFKLIPLIFSFCLLCTAFGQPIEKGTYISYNGGIIPKYAILKVDEDSSRLEVFIRWQGEWLTAWLPVQRELNDSFHAQLLITNPNGTLSNENALIERKKLIKGKLKNTFIGRIKFKFNKVETLPLKFEEVRQKGIEFTNRKD